MCASYDYVAVTMICRHDISTSHVEPAVKAVLESCIMENEADRFISNLRVTTDRYFNVIPYFVFMCVQCCNAECTVTLFTLCITSCVGCASVDADWSQ